MTKKLEKLTKEQEQLMLQVRDEWLNRFFGGFIEMDRGEVTRLVNWMYKFSKLKAPKKVVFVNSPMGAQLAANIIGGDQVGAQVWAQVWEQVRAQVEEQVRAQVEEQVRAQVWEQVEAQVWDQVGAQVWAQVWEQVGAQVEAQVRDQVGAQVEAQVRDQVGAQVWAQVEAQVGAQNLTHYSFSSYGNVSDFGWVAFYDFFTRIGVFNYKSFNKFKTLIECGMYDMIQLDKFCIVCEYPDYIGRDDSNNLHSEHRGAISWRDTYEQFYLHGIRFEHKLWNKIVKKTITPKEVLAIENVEQRMVAIKVYGMENFLEDLGAKLIDKSLSETEVLVDDQGIIYEVLDPNYDTSHLQVEKRLRVNELYQVDGLFTQFPQAYFLKFTCPSTGRVYCEGVDPVIASKHKSADKCMEAMLEIDDYSKLIVES